MPMDLSPAFLVAAVTLAVWTGLSYVVAWVVTRS